MAPDPSTSPAATFVPPMSTPSINGGVVFKVSDPSFAANRRRHDRRENARRFDPRFNHNEASLNAKTMLQLLEGDAFGFRIEEQHDEELHNHHGSKKNEGICA